MQLTTKPTNSTTKTYNPLLANTVIGNSLVVLCLFIRLAGLLIRLVPASVWLSFGRPFGATLTGQAIVPTALEYLDQLEDILLIIASPLLWTTLLFFVA